ncbi:MAG: AbrB/MazE/SpoVT family DNA-binding domain-containing protein, partial [Verrucomicrobia bacterium]|nr:AbrB/MazE/SpoVT family DNA-binding domain-containing protein [Verrucomicrobiota bacterium]
MKATTMVLTGKRKSAFPLDWCKRQGLENGGTLNVFEVGDALVIEPVKPLPPGLAEA